MKRILVIHFSQTGQLNEIVNSFVGPLMGVEGIDVVFEELRPQRSFPFPWGFTDFFNTFPETVHMVPVPMCPLKIPESEWASFDLVILAYQVWFLSPSLPVSSFLQSPEGKRLLDGKPVITVIGCRNMWLQAQERVKELLAAAKATLIDNVVLIDAGSTAMSFISTPVWMLTGNKGPIGILPKAGVSEDNIRSVARFGKAIKARLQSDQPDLFEPMLKGLKAVDVNERLIASEVMARRGFVIWGKLLRAIGSPGNPVRKIFVYVYVVYLVTLILTFVPLSAVIKKMVSPLTQARIRQQKEYFSQPSGSDIYNLDKYQ